MFIIRQKCAGGKVCVHLATSVHRPGKSPCHIRQHLGMLDAKTGELLLSKKVAEPNASMLKLMAEKDIAYSGRRAAASGKVPRPLAAALRDGVRVEEIGRVAALLHLAETAGLVGSLVATFGADDTRRLLCASIHQVCEGEPLYLMEDWLEDVSGDSCDGVSPSAIGVLAREVGSKQTVALRRKFFVEWIKACGMPRVLIHDTTSISTYSHRLEDAEWGYNRDGESLPQMNLALVVAKGNRVPIWYRTLPGSIPDVASLQGTSAQLADLGLAKCSFTLDRGYFSNSNVTAMLSAKIKFTIGVPLHLKQAAELLEKHRQSLTEFKRTFLANGALVSHVPCAFSVGRKGGERRKIPAHLYFCQERRAQMSERLGKTVLEIAGKAAGALFENIAEAKEWIEENAGGFSKYLRIGVKRGKPVIRAKPSQMAVAAGKFGMTLIATSAGKSAPKDREEVLADYRSRDIAEKVFDSYKNATGNKRLRTGDDESADGRIFIAFLAVTIRSLMENALRKSDLKKSLTVPEALAVLRKIKRLWRASGEPLLLEVPKKSREVALAMGIAPNSMGDAVKFLAREATENGRGRK